MLRGELLRVLGERLRVELVRRHVREVARAVRPLRDQCGALDRRAHRVRFGVADDDPLELTPLAVTGLPAARRVRADDRPLDERRRLVGERNRERLVEQPGERAADARDTLRRDRAGRAQRVEVDRVARPDAGGDEPRRRELAVEVEEDGLALLAAQLAALAEPRELAAELLVDDPGAFAAERLCHRQRQRVRRLLPG